MRENDIGKKKRGREEWREIRRQRMSAKITLTKSEKEKVYN